MRVLSDVDRTHTKLSFDIVGTFLSDMHLYVFLPVHLRVEGESKVKLCNVKHQAWDDLELIACNTRNTELSIQVYVTVCRQVI